MARSLRLVSESDRDGVHSENGRIRVVLADDHSAVRRSLRQVLDSEESIEVIAEAHDLDSLMRVIAARPAVLALDPSLLGTPRLETLQRAHTQAPNTEIVVLSMTDDPNLAQQTLDAGATGFVLKDMAAEELPIAIRSAAAGERYVSPRIADRLSAADR
ncbi:MAG TPA: response regulator transcription factor [Solirubrobacteraceae bacterium]|nr:response regulator transcription factor [Solirubrobacteraceae bacterium]